jgi:hypothetical protein
MARECATTVGRERGEKSLHTHILFGSYYLQTLCICLGLVQSDITFCWATQEAYIDHSALPPQKNNVRVRSRADRCAR